MKGLLAGAYVPDFRQTLEYVKVVIWCNSLLGCTDKTHELRLGDVRQAVVIKMATGVSGPVLPVADGGKR